MRKMIVMVCLLIFVGFGVGNTWAATGKCTVVKVDGERMVLDCNKQTKGFSKGTEIKIKTDKKRNSQND